MKAFGMRAFQHGAAENAESGKNRKFARLSVFAIKKALLAVGFGGTKIFFLFFSVFLLSACAPTPAALSTSTPFPLGTLIPYRTPTLTPTQAVPTRLPLPTEAPAPTPTPFTYTVKQGDTMLAIAFNYGLSLEQLLAANPTVQPRMLSVGTVLVIPLEGELATPQPTEAPLPLQASEPLCYPQADGELWCLMMVLNDQETAVENLTGRISLFSSGGESLRSQTVYAPLDLLKPGEKVVLAAFFPAPGADQWIVQGELLSALPVSEGDPRYLEASVQVGSLNITLDGQSARLTGVVLLEEGQPVPGSLWLSGAAYDEQDKPVGMRTWQLVNFCLPDESCLQVPFEGVIYSLGPAIAKIEILVQARP